jgi:NADH-quinone oxidoreductase subunit M
MYFLIGHSAGARRQYAAVKFFLYSLVGGLFMLAAVIGLWVLGGHTFDWARLTEASLSTNAERWLFLGFFIAFAIKAPFFPFHTWLPDAGGAAQRARRLCSSAFSTRWERSGSCATACRCSRTRPSTLHRWRSPWHWSASFTQPCSRLDRTTLSGSCRTRPWRTLALSAVGCFAFTPRPVRARSLYMVNHGLATGLLFLLVGMLVSRRGSALVSDFGGAASFCPLLAGLLLFAGLASLSLPGMAPFVSEFLVLLGTFTVNKTVAVVATLGIILAAGYVLLDGAAHDPGRAEPRAERHPAYA